MSKDILSISHELNSITNSTIAKDLDFHAVVIYKNSHSYSARKLFKKYEF